MGGLSLPEWQHTQHEWHQGNESFLHKAYSLAWWICHLHFIFIRNWLFFIDFENTLFFSRLWVENLSWVSADWISADWFSVDWISTDLVTAEKDLCWLNCLLTKPQTLPNDSQLIDSHLNWRNNNKIRSFGSMQNIIRWRSNQPTHI